MTTQIIIPKFKTFAEFLDCLLQQNNVQSSWTYLDEKSDNRMVYETVTIAGWLSVQRMDTGDYMIEWFHKNINKSDPIKTILLDAEKNKLAHVGPDNTLYGKFNSVFTKYRDRAPEYQAYMKSNPTVPPLDITKPSPTLPWVYVVPPTKVATPVANGFDKLSQVCLLCAAGVLSAKLLTLSGLDFMRIGISTKPKTVVDKPRTTPPTDTTKIVAFNDARCYE